MTHPNIPLLRKVVEWVEAQERLNERDREWQQDIWFEQVTVGNWCGTGMCVAGKTVVLGGGYNPVFQNGAYVGLEDEDGNHVDKGISITALDLLGLPSAWSGREDWLFAADNTAADIRRIAEDLAGEPL